MSSLPMFLWQSFTLLTSANWILENQDCLVDVLIVHIPAETIVETRTPPSVVHLVLTCLTYDQLGICSDNSDVSTDQEPKFTWQYIGTQRCHEVVKPFHRPSKQAMLLKPQSLPSLLTKASLSKVRYCRYR